MLSSQTYDRSPRVDYTQLLAVLALMFISVAFVYSATRVSEANIAHWYHQSFFKQVIWFALGLGAAAAVCVVDYHVISRWSIVAYWASILVLVLVLIPPIGKTHLGAYRWIDLGPFQFQPSEFGKLAFILAEAHFLSRPADELRQRGLFWKSIGLLALPFVLIMKEPDLGSALVLVPTGLVMLFVAGTPRRYLFQLIGLGGLLAVLFIGGLVYAPAKYRIKMHPYQVERLLVYFGRDYVDYFAPGATGAPKAELTGRTSTKLNTMSTRR